MSRLKTVLIVFAVMVAVCSVIGTIIEKPFPFVNVIAIIPFLGWAMGDRVRDRYILKVDIFKKKKWKEQNFIAGLVPAIYPFFAWAIYVSFGKKIEIPADTLFAIGSFLGMLLAGMPGKDKNRRKR